MTAGGSGTVADCLLEGWADLGGSSGYVVPIYTAADARRIDNCQLLAEAGLVYIADGPDVLTLVRALSSEPALQAIGLAFDDGAPVVAAGLAAAAMGAWVADPGGSGSDEPGWNWVRSVIVEPRFAGSKIARSLSRGLTVHPDCLGLGIPRDAALALGPDGRVETLGPGQPTVVLGEHVAR
jgi:cyanophycinase